MPMDKIEWTVVEIVGTEFEFEGRSFDAGDFQRVRSPWGDAPNAAELESLGVDGWLARGMGNDDPYVYVVNLDSVADEDSVKVALIKLAGDA